MVPLVMRNHLVTSAFIDITVCQIKEDQSMDVDGVLEVVRIYVAEKCNPDILRLTGLFFDSLNLTF